MKLVRIIKEWDYPDLMRQTPGGAGVWGDVRFTLDPAEDCDAVVVLNRSPVETRLRRPRRGVWAILQEPPNERFKPMHRGIPAYSRIYTQDPSRAGARYIQSQPALPWHVDRDYDFLRSHGPTKKDRPLSWITSNKAMFRGHQDRLRFLSRLRSRMAFDLFGRGFSPLGDKWDGLACYRYTIAVENFRGAHYWSEKLADAFLAWTMPIYCGCTNIADYFPPEAMVLLDIDAPDAVAQINDLIHGDRYERSLEAIAEARRRVLEQYQLFPFIAAELNRPDPAPLEGSGQDMCIPYTRPYPRPTLLEHLRSACRRGARLVAGPLLRGSC